MAGAGGSAASARPQAELMEVAVGVSPGPTSFSVPPGRHQPFVWASVAATGVLACATLLFNISGTPAWQGLPEPTPLTNERAEVDLPMLTKPVRSAIGRFRDDAVVAPKSPIAALDTPTASPAAPSANVTPVIEGDAPARVGPAHPASLAFAGVWAPTGQACSPRDNRGGYLPAVITAEGAFAGETSCAFRKTRAEGAGWVVAASCTSPKGRWSSTVRLGVEGNRLTWSSARGIQTYVRCGVQRAEQTSGRG